VVLAALRCSEPLTTETDASLTFEVIDVGQGNAALALVEDSALFFDVGPPEGFDELSAQYAACGSPPVAALFLSHGDNDHAGALAQFCKTFAWSGTLVVSQFADTALLHKQCAGAKQPIRFVRLASNDVLPYGKNSTVTCLWPPAVTVPEVDSTENNWSLVLRIALGSTSIMVPGDIDSTVTRILCSKYASTLRSNLLIVPHHGSRSAADHLFYGFVNPSCAIISVGKNNDYGHPHEEVLSVLTACSIPFRITALEGSMGWRSNGFYWTELF